MQIATQKLSLDSEDGVTWSIEGRGSLDNFAELAQLILVEQARTRAREEGGEEELQRLRRENEALRQQLRGQ